MKYNDRAKLTRSHVITYGDPKVGKSTLVSQLAEAGFRLKWISMDNGHGIIDKLSAAARELVDIIVLPDTRGWPIASETCLKLIEGKALNLCVWHGKDGCEVCKKAGAAFDAIESFHNLGSQDIVVLDNGSQLSDSYINRITKDKPVDYKLQLDDWGALKYHLADFFGKVQQAPFNIAMIAHSVEEKLTDGSVRIMPMIGSSQFAPKVSGFFDHVVYLNMMNKSHRAGSSSTYLANVITGSRTDVAVETMKVTSLAPFFDGTVPKVEVHDAGKILGVAAATVKEQTPAAIASATAPQTTVGEAVSGAGQGVGAPAVVKESSVSTAPQPVTPTASAGRLDELGTSSIQPVNTPAVAPTITAAKPAIAVTGAPADLAERARNALLNLRKPKQ